MQTTALNIDIDAITRDFAACLKIADSKRPQAANSRSGDVFKPGIGPHNEAQTVKLVANEMERHQPARYEKRIGLGIAYPELSRQKCDFCLGNPGDWDWAIEVKMLRFLGDNGKLNDNILMHILSPYPEHRSAVTDCRKLARSTIARSKGILIYGYDHQEWPLEPAIDAFEALAAREVVLGARSVAKFDNLVHPVHESGSVFGWRINC